MSDVPDRKIVGVMGGALVGADPFSPRNWSGTSRFFFTNCEKQGILSRAFGVDISRFKRWLLIARNFTRPREVWRQKYYLDTQYYRWLTQELAKQFRDEDFEHTILQLGGIYKVPSIVNGRAPCFSYHDGNLVQLINSPHFQTLGLSSRKVDKALQYEREVYNSLDKILTMSEYLRRSFIEDFGIPAERVVTIGGGINLEELPDAQEGKDYSQPNILFIGVDFARKGGWQLLDAFKIVQQRIPKAQLHIAGPHTLKIPTELSKGVTYYGFLNKSNPEQKATLQRLFHNASLFVMPSLYEPFGIAPMEAMLYQVPAVLPNAWAFPEMVEPGHNGALFQVGQVEDLAETLHSLLQDPNQLTQMGINGREKVLQNFTWEKVIERLKKELG